MKANSVALPKTYHQRAPRGTRCVTIGPNVSVIPTRSSSHSQARLNVLLIISVPWSGNDRDWSGFYLHFAIQYPRGIPGQGAFGRPRSHIPILVKNASVTGAHKQSCLGHPTHRTAQMRAVDRESDKAVLAFPPQPRRS